MGEDIVNQFKKAIEDFESGDPNAIENLMPHLNDLQLPNLDSLTAQAKAKKFVDHEVQRRVEEEKLSWNVQNRLKEQLYEES